MFSAGRLRLRFLVIKFPMTPQLSVSFSNISNRYLSLPNGNFSDTRNVQNASVVFEEWKCKISITR